MDSYRALPQKVQPDLPMPYGVFSYRSLSKVVPVFEAQLLAAMSKASASKSEILGLDLDSSLVMKISFSS
jgi:hypothetical protein